MVLLYCIIRLYYYIGIVMLVVFNTVLSMYEINDIYIGLYISQDTRIRPRQY